MLDPRNIAFDPCNKTLDPCNEGFDPGNERVIASRIDGEESPAGCESRARRLGILILRHGNKENVVNRARRGLLGVAEPHG